jgi:uncharacterized membrane protein YqjE
VHNQQSFKDVLNETKQDLKHFFETRVQIFKSEIEEKVRSLKYSVPLLVGAAILLVTGWMTLTFTLVALVHAWFVPSGYAWAIGGGIVTIFYVLLGGALGWFGYMEFKSIGFMPQRTVTVLKQDKLWIDSERRAA